MFPFLYMWHKGSDIFLFFKYIMYFCRHHLSRLAIKYENKHYIKFVTMRKKIFAIAVALLTAVTASAQFEKNKVYVGGSLTGLNMNYSGADKFSLGVQAQGGYFIADDFLLYGQAGYTHSGHADDTFNVGAGARYYIEQNGIFLGANCKYVRSGGDFDDVMPGVEVGYAFFLSHTVTVEPALYYQQSFKKHSDYSTFGLRIGVGVYLFKD